MTAEMSHPGRPPDEAVLAPSPEREPVRTFARLLVEYSTDVGPGDRFLIEAQPVAEPLVAALYEEILRAGGHPQVLIDLPGLEELLLRHGSDDQLTTPPELQQHAYQGFQGRIRIASLSNTKAQSGIEPKRLALRRKGMQPILRAQMTRGASGEFRWVSTLYPTQAYAQDAEMSLAEYADFVYRACHVMDEGQDPVLHWQTVRRNQQRVIAALSGHDRVEIRGPDCELTLSIRGRSFQNACGIHNMPDGEIYTGPVEESVNGWIRFTYPAIYNARAAERVRLTFVEGRVVEVAADKNEDFVREMLATDEGARYVGELGIGTNFGIQRHTGTILFDEKIGGTIHLALGAGYPETGSSNTSAIHWDMIYDMRQGSEILVDGDAFYRDGAFVV